MKQFEEYLIRIGKSENTALTYCRNIRMYFSWCRDSFGSEPKELYRSNVLEYISYMRNIRGYTVDTIADNLLETQMETAKCRDAVVQGLLRLLKKKLVLVL